MMPTTAETKAAPGMTLNPDDFETRVNCAVSKKRDFLNDHVPTDVAEAAGMLSQYERRMLLHYAGQVYTGAGAIIDGGSFFGSSVYTTATGLKSNPGFQDMDFSKMPGGKPIHAYELGFLPAPQSDKVDPNRMFGKTPYRMGDSFVPILEETIAPHRDLVSLNIGDLNAETWPDAPIELCFIDVCKTAKLNSHVSAQFYSHLIPGGSTLINQDFFFDRLPWIRVTMGYLSEYFEWEGRVFTSSIYRTIKPIPAEVAQFDPYTDATLDECLAFHDCLPNALLDEKTRFMMALSKAYLTCLKGDKNQALDRINQAEKDFETLVQDADNPRGNKFRLDRARRQITNGNIFKVS